MKDIILGSTSPRRKYLLEKLDIPFRVVHRETSEDYPGHLVKEEIPIYICEQKAGAFEKDIFQDHSILITADTIVWLENQVLGKPTDIQDAHHILRSLSGKRHQVITSVCLTSLEKSSSFWVSTDVYFKDLDDEEIKYYVENYEVLDKAGAYAIQEWIGYIGIDRIEGSFYNVMGLPVKVLYDELLIFL